jgi:formate dehydrogenase
VIHDRLAHPDKRAHIGSDELVAEVARLREVGAEDPEFPFRMFGRRELRSINSWMKNSAKLSARSPLPSCAVHPDDASSLGIADGNPVRITSRAGSVQLPAEVTTDVARGSVCVPHGWGNTIGVDGVRPGPGGASANELNRAGAANVEQISGMSILNGVAVRLEALDQTAGNV